MTLRVEIDAIFQAAEDKGDENKRAYDAGGESAFSPLAFRLGLTERATRESLLLIADRLDAIESRGDGRWKRGSIGTGSDSDDRP